MSSPKRHTHHNTIDEALSSLNLEKLSEIIYESQSPSASTGSSADTEPPDPESAGTETSETEPSGNESPDRKPSGPEKPGSETDASSPQPAPEAEPEEAKSERDAPGGPPPPNDETSSKRKLKSHVLESTARGSSSSRKTSQSRGTSTKRQTSTGEAERPVERPSFTIYADQAATLRVLSGSKADPLGATASEIAGRALDLFGFNGRHPAAALHGQTLSKGASAPGPLIEERQWEDLLAKADEMVASLANPSEKSLGEGPLGGESLAEEPIDEDETRLACVCYLVQEALYEADFGDRRRRRKGPL